MNAIIQWAYCPLSSKGGASPSYALNIALLWQGRDERRELDASVPQAVDKGIAA